MQQVWTRLASAWLVCLAALLTWVLLTPIPALRNQLKTLQFWSLEITVLIGLGLGVAVLWQLRRQFGRNDMVALIATMTVALGVTIGVAARTNRIFYDEQIYQNIGQSLADSRLAQMCNDGAIENRHLRCANGEYNKQPYAFPHLLSVAYRLVGVGTTAAFAVNAAAMAAAVGFLYLLVVLLFSDRVAAFFAALLLALTPEQLVWSATAAAEPAASWACIAALLAAACFIRAKSTLALVGVAVAAAYAIQFRPESLLVLPVIGLLLWQRAREELTRPRLWWVALAFLALVATHVAHLFAVRNEGWGTTRAPLSILYVASNLRVNGWFYIGDARFPAIYSILAIVGLSARRAEAGRLAMAGYFLMFFGFLLLFYAGSYDYGADVRYSLATYPPLAILGGFGLAEIAGWIKRVRHGVPAVPLLTAALALQFLWYLPIVRSVDDGAWAARADVAFAQSITSAVRGRSYVLTHNPGMFQVWGINAGQISLVVNNPAYLQMLAVRYPDGVYLHWNFWCNVQDPIQRGFCTKALALGPWRMVSEHQVRDQHYVLYRLADGSVAEH